MRAKRAKRAAGFFLGFFWNFELPDNTLKIGQKIMKNAKIYNFKLNYVEMRLFRDTFQTLCHNVQLFVASFSLQIDLLSFLSCYYREFSPSFLVCLFSGRVLKKLSPRPLWRGLKKELQMPFFLAVNHLLWPIIGRKSLKSKKDKSGQMWVLTLKLNQCN